MHRDFFGRVRTDVYQTVADIDRAVGARRGENTAERFFRIWTRKESCIKMTGEGLQALSRTDTFNIPTGTLIHSVTLLCGGEKYSASVCFGARR